MKYGYLFYQKPLKSGGSRKMNLGDPIQTCAVINLLKECGIPDSDIVPIDRYNVRDYSGEDVTLIINGIEESETMFYQTHNLPPSSKITPLYFSFSAGRPLKEAELLNMKKFAPIGCRDERTMRYLKGKGIPAYISGCITLTLPERSETPKAAKVFLSDIPDSLTRYIPEELLAKSERVTHGQILEPLLGQTRLSNPEADAFQQNGYDLLKRYKNEASLVITSRLHAAAPCIAMGIPVVLAKDFFDFRFGFIDKYLRLHTPDKFNEINWNPPPVDITAVKNDIKELFKACLFNTEKGALIEKVNGHFAKGFNNREKYQFSHEAAIAKIPFPSGGFSFSMWGITRYSCKIACAVLRLFPNAKIMNWIDTYKTGTFEDMEILHPSQIGDLLKGTIIIVPTRSAHSAAKELMQSTDMRFVLVDKLNVECFGFNG